MSDSMPQEQDVIFKPIENNVWTNRTGYIKEAFLCAGEAREFGAKANPCARAVYDPPVPGVQRRHQIGAAGDHRWLVPKVIRHHNLLVLHLRERARGQAQPLAV